jgi:small-conductance mechanosensitive channel
MPHPRANASPGCGPGALKITLAGVIFGWLLLVATGPVQAADASPVPMVRIAEPATLVFWNRPIIELRAAVADLDPKARVARILARLEGLPADARALDVIALPMKVGPIEGLKVGVGPHEIMTILREDLDPEGGETLEQLGERTQAQLREALTARAEQQRIPLLLRGIGLTTLATVILTAALWLVARLRRRALARSTVISPARRLPLFGVALAPLIKGLEQFTIKLTAFSIDVAVIYLWLTFAFAQFPYSAPWGRQLGEYLTDLLSGLGKGTLEAMPGLFTVLVIFLLTRIVTRVVSSFLQGVESGRLTLAWLEPDTARATRRMVVVLIWIFAITVAYPHIPGSGSDVFKGVSVFVGLMATLGSAGLVNQLMSGLVLVFSRAFKPGDYVRVGEAEGVVSQLGALSTKIVTRRREEITIPNAVLTGNNVTNYSRLTGEHGAIAATTVTIGYDAPWRQVHAMLLLAASRTQGVRGSPQAFVVQRALSDFYVEYELCVHLERPELRVPVLSRLHANIQDAFNEHGVQIMSPHFEAQPEGRVTVDRSQWHAAPARPTEEKDGD